MFQVLEDTNKGWHALTTHEVQGTVANLINSICLLEWILLESTHFGLFAGHDCNDHISNLANIHDRVRIFPVNLQEYQTLFPT